MKVVNIKEARASRSYGQRSVVYIGRGSAFGNPFTHLPLGRTKALVQVNTLDDAVDFFYRWAKGEASWDDVIPAASRTRLLAAIDELQGDELLGCYCAEGAKCHGQMIARLWNERRQGRLKPAGL